jgi:hypothetical protein
LHQKVLRRDGWSCQCWGRYATHRSNLGWWMNRSDVILSGCSVRSCAVNQQQQIASSEEPLPPFSRWENASSARDLVRLNDALLNQFLRFCGKQVRQRGEILLDIDSTDDPTHASNNSAFSTAPTISICTAPCSSSGVTLDACRRRGCDQAMPPVMRALFRCRCGWCRDWKPLSPVCPLSCAAMLVSPCRCCMGSASSSESSMH